MSACLLGEYCRYDGQTKKFSEVLEFLKEYEVVPFCPEAPLFGTPRGRISVIRRNGENRVLKDQTDEDVTKLLEDEVSRFFEQNSSMDTLLLKSKSPSCGYRTTPLLNEKREQIGLGNGIAVDTFLKLNPKMKILDEFSIF